MVKASKGVLIECDASIMAIIAKIDAQDHSYVMEELDDEHCVVKADRLDELKRRLKMILKDTVRQPEESGSE